MRRSRALSRGGFGGGVGPLPRPRCRAVRGDDSLWCYGSGSALVFWASCDGRARRPPRRRARRVRLPARNRQRHACEATRRTGSFDDVVTIVPSSPTRRRRPTAAFVPVDAGPACTPDLNWCTTHCGTGPDNCGQPRGCSSLCPQGESCISNACTCTPDPTWCNGRCGKTTDNCGNDIDCLSCEAGVTCYSNVCGCMPESPSTTCSGKQCASAPQQLQPRGQLRRPELDGVRLGRVLPLERHVLHARRHDGVRRQVPGHGDRQLRAVGALPADVPEQRRLPQGRLLHAQRLRRKLRRQLRPARTARAAR